MATIPRSNLTVYRVDRDKLIYSLENTTYLDTRQFFDSFIETIVVRVLPFLGTHRPIYHPSVCQTP